MKFEALHNFGIEVKAMISAFVAKLGLRPRPTNVTMQKIDGLTLEIYGMLSTMFIL